MWKDSVLKTFDGCLKNVLEQHVFWVYAKASLKFKAVGITQLFLCVSLNGQYTTKANV